MATIKRFLEWTGDSTELTPAEETQLIQLGLVKPAAWLDWFPEEPVKAWFQDRNPVYAELLLKVPDQGIEDDYRIYLGTVDQDEPVIRRDIEAFMFGELPREEYQARAWARAPKAARVTLKRWAGHYDGIEVRDVRWLHNPATGEWQPVWTDAR